MAKTDFGSVELTDSGAFLKIGATSILEAHAILLTAITAAAADINQIKGAGRVPKVAVVALAAIDTAGGIFSWANPEVGSIMITRALVNVTTKSTGACTLDIGTTTVSGTTLSDTLIDGVDVGTATGLFSNLKNPGTNGVADQLLAAGKWVTGSMATGASAGLVGNVYIEYILV